MKEKDLRDKFEDVEKMTFHNHLTVKTSTNQCVQITLDYAREEAIGFGLFLNEGRFTQYGNVWLNPKQGTDDNGDWLFFKTSELYEIYLTTKTK